MAVLKTPGVYVVDKNAFPVSAVAVATAVPVFIGYTGIAVRNQKSVVNVLTRITSMVEYSQYFGNAFRPKCKIEGALATDDHAFDLNGAFKKVTIPASQCFYLYNSVRF